MQTTLAAPLVTDSDIQRAAQFTSAFYYHSLTGTPGMQERIAGMIAQMRDEMRSQIALEITPVVAGTN